MFGFAKLFSVGALAISASAAPLLDAVVGANVDALGLAKVNAGVGAHARDVVDAAVGADVLGLVGLNVDAAVGRRDLVDAAVGADVLGLVGLNVDAAVGRRDDASKSLQAVIGDVVTQLNPLVGQLSKLSCCSYSAHELIIFFSRAHRY